MFEIPENLPMCLAPLAWLVGNWQGWGTLVGSGEEDSPDMPVLQKIDADILGENLRMRVSVFSGQIDEVLDPMWTAEEGLNHIGPGELLWEETMYWTVTSPLALVPPNGEEPRELRVTAADTRGRAILWAGVAVGPRIRLDSDSVALSPSADHVGYVSRMFGLVGGELMWASDNKVGDDDFETEFTGRLQRAQPIDPEAN